MGRGPFRVQGGGPTQEEWATGVLQRQTAAAPNPLLPSQQSRATDREDTKTGWGRPAWRGKVGMGGVQVSMGVRGCQDYQRIYAQRGTEPSPPKLASGPFGSAKLVGQRGKGGAIGFKSLRSANTMTVDGGCWGGTWSQSTRGGTSPSYPVARF